MQPTSQPPSQEVVVVTGGAGFIGSHVVSQLLARGCRVLVLDNFRTGKRENLSFAKDNELLSIHEVDVIDALWPSLHELTSQTGPIDRIIHLAAQTSVIASIQDPFDDLRSNLLSTLQVLEYARTHKVKKVVFSSSAAVYGDLEALKIHEEMTKEPLSPYGINKRASELQLRYYHEVHGVPTTSLRFFNVYGPRQDPASPYSGVISIFLQRATQHQTLTIFGDGNQTRDFVYVEDLAELIVKTCLSSQGNGGIFNLGTSTPHSINDLAQQVISVCQSNSRIEHKDARPGEILHSCADITAASDHLGFQPRTSLHKGLQKTAAWFHANQPNS